MSQLKHCAPDDDYQCVCWGSWANNYKGVKNYRFELFCWDYAIGIFVAALILGLTMGSTRPDASSLLRNIHSANISNLINALIGGALFNLANLLLVAAIDMAGLAIAFPISIGIALVVGVVLSYTLQPKGNALLLALGVACALVAVLLDGKAYGTLANASRSVSRKSLIVCVVSGILMGLWAPFMTHAMTRGNALGPYSAAVFLTLGALLSCLIWNIYFMKHPLIGDPVSFAAFFRGPSSGHALGLLGGCIWSVGTVFNLVAGSLTGEAVSYAVGQSVPVVAALWGIFAWKEFKNSGPRSKLYLAGMFFFYAMAICLLAKATS